MDPVGWVRWTVVKMMWMKNDVDVLAMGKTTFFLFPIGVGGFEGGEKMGVHSGASQ